MLKFAEAVVALYGALKERDQCTACGGQGYSYVWLGDEEGEVAADPCECSLIAEFALEHYQRQAEAALRRYAQGKDIEPDPEIIFDSLFGNVR